VRPCMGQRERLEERGDPQRPPLGWNGLGCPGRLASRAIVFRRVACPTQVCSATLERVVFVGLAEYLLQGSLIRAVFGGWGYPVATLE
jgi:hypothetical protein